MIPLYLLVTALTRSLAVETLQSHMDYSTTERTVTERTTTPGWPKLSLDRVTKSPMDSSIFSPHTRAETGVESTTMESVQVVTPVTTISETVVGYQRHMLPYLSDRKHWTHPHSNTSLPSRLRNRRIRPVRGETVEVSIPRIFVDMAFTGHYNRISVPRSRVHQADRVQPGDVRVILPRAILTARSQPRIDNGQQGSHHASIHIPKRLIVEGVQRAQERINSSYFWPLRLLEGARERMSSLAAGMFNLFRRRSNTLDTLYRPHKSQLTSPYQTSSSSNQLPSTLTRKDKYFGSNNWRPVTNPDLVRTERKGQVMTVKTDKKDGVRTDRKDEAVNDTNYWKVLPNFVTSSGKKLKTYFWRQFPRFIDRSSNVSLGYWVPGSPGPLVWGDLEGKLETVQSQYIKQNPKKLKVTSRDP